MALWGELLMINGTTSAPLVNGTCADEVGQPLIPALIGVILLIGQIISYLPQIYSLVRSGSSEGLSSWTYFAAHIGAHATLLNAIILQWPKIDCCLHVSAAVCQGHLIKLYQLLVPALGTFSIFVLLLVYFKTPQNKPQAFKVVLGAFLFDIIAVVLLASFVLVLLFFHSGTQSKPTLIYGKTLGMISIVMTIIQWTPQIFKTFMRKSVGVLSIWMLLIQCPGSFVLVLYQAVLAKPPANITTWAPYAVAGIEQFVLILLWLYLRFCYRKPRSADGSDNDPLLGNENETANDESMRDPTASDSHKYSITVNPSHSAEADHATSAPTATPSAEVSVVPSTPTDRSRKPIM